ncbi:hypothetical protein ACNOYE_32320 [Nannocystaceae bacterium ST9]
MPRARLAILLATLTGGLLLGPALADATIEEQRARLPPPATECDDQIAGQWRAHVFYAHVMQWYVFVLDIRRGQANQLHGTIHAEFWDGDADDQQPPLCNLGVHRGAVVQNASGEADQLDIRFDAIDWRDEQACGSLGMGYLLDRFSGTIDPERMEFQSLLNADAPQWRDVPTVFRRVRCATAGSADDREPKIVVAPPPYQPPEGERGCGFR